MEELDIGMKCIKYMLFTANFMFVMVGFLLISIGTTIKTIYDEFDIFMELHYFSPSTLAIAIGIILFIVALFGCFGALKESTCLINCFAALLSLILILEVAVAIAAYSMRGNLKIQIERHMKQSLENYSNSIYERDAWDFMQENLHCCGIDSPNDWNGILTDTTIRPSNGNASSDGSYPISCCQKNLLTGECLGLWSNGCLENLVYIVSECALLLGCGAIAVAFIQLLGVIFAHMLAKAVRKIKTQNLVENQLKRDAFYKQMDKTTLPSPTPVIYTNYTPDYTEA